MKWPTLAIENLPVVLRAVTLVLAGAGVHDLALNNAVGTLLGVVLQTLFAL